MICRHGRVSCKFTIFFVVMGLRDHFNVSAPKCLFSNKRLGNTKALVDNLADAFAEVQAETLAKTRSNAQVLVDTLAGTLAEVEAETLVDTRGDAQELVDILADTPAEVDDKTL